MTRLMIGGIVFLLGAWFGFYQAHAASNINYTSYITGTDTGKMAPAYMNGYAAGTFDTMRTIVWFANESPNDYAPAVLTKDYLCLQKIPNDSAIVAGMKPYFAQQPNIVAANEIIIHGCDVTSAAAQMVHSVGSSGGRAPKAGAGNAK